MKITIAYYLLLIYIIAACKPVLPVLKDAVAHTFWGAEHLATVHGHDGNQHVHNEIGAANQNHEDKNQPATKFAEPVSIHLPSNDNHNFNRQFLEDKKYFSGLNVLQIIYVEIDSPPPKANRRLIIYSV